MTNRLVAALLPLLAFAVFAQEDGEASSWKGAPVVVRVSSDDLLDSRRVREFERIIDKAEEERVSVLAFEWSVSGPVPLETVERVLVSLDRDAPRVVSFVRGSATGPGALLALSADALYLRPGALVGSAGPSGSPAAKEDEEEDSSETRAYRQDLSVLRARARSLAESRGYRPQVLEGMVDPSLKVMIGDEELSAEGEVLTLTAAEAIRMAEGKPVLAKGLADDIAAVLRGEGIDGEPLLTSPREFGENENRERLSKKSSVEDSGDTVEAPASEGSSLFGRRDEESYRGKAVVLEIGMDTLATGKAAFDFIERTLKKAELDGAAAVVFDMHTPGGIAWYTDSLVLDTLQNVSIPTFTFVNPKAESAGAIIAVGTDHIYMRPAATIGSALVVASTGQDLAEAMSDKVTQMIIGTVRNVAELNGHNPDVAEAFVTRDKEVKIDGTVIHEAGSVLNLNTIRATEIVGGRPVLAKGVANSIDEILEEEGIDAETVSAEPLGMEAFAHWVQKLSVLLIVVGLAGAYLELNSPGFGLPGLVSVLAFSVFFFGNYFAGNLAGYELAVLLVLGLLLIAVEIFVFPGAIVPGAVGGALVLAALGLAMVDRVDLEWKWSGLPGAESWISIFRGAFIGLAVGLAGALVAVLAGMRFLPETKLGNRFVLQEAIAGGAALAPVVDLKDEEAASLVGAEGEAATDLVPSGKGRFDGRLLDIVSDGQFIERGSSLRVIAHEGSRIVVAKIS